MDGPKSLTHPIELELYTFKAEEPQKKELVASNKIILF